MARLHFEINNQFDFKFIDMVYKLKDMRKGNMTRTLEEAMELWITNGVREVRA